MPHLTNCAHSEDGWCLDCMKEQHEAIAPILRDCDELKTLIAEMGKAGERLQVRIAELEAEIDALRKAQK